MQANLSGMLLLGHRQLCQRMFRWMDNLITRPLSHRTFMSCTSYTELQIEKLDLLQMPFLYILFPSKNSSYMNIHLNQCYSYPIRKLWDRPQRLCKNNLWKLVIFTHCLQLTYLHISWYFGNFSRAGFVLKNCNFCLLKRYHPSLWVNLGVLFTHNMKFSLGPELLVSYLLW